MITRLLLFLSSFIYQFIIHTPDMLIHVTEVIQQGFLFFLQSRHPIIIYLLEVLQVYILHTEILYLYLSLVDGILLLTQLQLKNPLLLLVCLQFLLKVVDLVSGVLDQSLQEVSAVLESFILLPELRNLGTEIFCSFIFTC